MVEVIGFVSTIVAGYIWFKLSFTFWPYILASAVNNEMSLLATIIILTWPFVIVSLPGALGLSMATGVIRGIIK